MIGCVVVVIMNSLLLSGDLEHGLSDALSELRLLHERYSIHCDICCTVTKVAGK